MGFLSSIFGSSGGASKEYKDGLRGTLGQYDSAMADEFGPTSLQNDMSRYTEGLDRNLASQAAAGTTRMGDMGFRGTPNFGFMRAASIAGAEQAMMARQRAARRRAILERLGILQPLGDATYKQPSQGLLGAAASMYGASHGFGSLGGGGGNKSNLAAGFDGDFTSTIPNAPGLPYSGGVASPIPTTPGLSYHLKY